MSKKAVNKKWNLRLKRAFAAMDAAGSKFRAQQKPFRCAEFVGELKCGLVFSRCACHFEMDCPDQR